MPPDAASSVQATIWTRLPSPPWPGGVAQARRPSPIEKPGSAGHVGGRPFGSLQAAGRGVDVEQAQPADRRVGGVGRSRPRTTRRSRPSGRRSRRAAPSTTTCGPLPRRGRPARAAAPGVPRRGATSPCASDRHGAAPGDGPALARDRRPAATPSRRGGSAPVAGSMVTVVAVTLRSGLAADDVAGQRATDDDLVAGPRGEGRAAVGRSGPASHPARRPSRRRRRARPARRPAEP